MHTIPNLSAPLTRELFASLRALLPPASADTAEARAARDELAMAAAAALLPDNAFEAGLAAEIVAAQAYARHCFHRAAQSAQNPQEVRRCIAQASVMMRHARSGLVALQRTQALREKAEAEMRPAAMERAGYWFREIPVPAPVQPAPTEPAAGQPAVAARDEGTNPPYEAMSEAEQYAVLYPDRAARIRTEGGLPARLDFGPPGSEIVDDIVHGNSPILRALDRHVRAAVPA
jgi:hypothetical protein